MAKQKTLAVPIHVAGQGLHTGAKVEADIRPASAGSGIFFVREDLAGHPIVHALAEHVADTSRGTTIVEGEARVSTLEHLRYGHWVLITLKYTLMDQRCLSWMAVLASMHAK